MNRKGFVLATVLFFWAGSVEAGMVARKNTTLIVVHHSATTSGTAMSIRRYHKEAKKWHDIGYHYVITREGKKEPGRSERLVGAHARTGCSFNRNPFSVGVCLIGTGAFTNKQKDRLVQLLVRLCQTYHINPLDKRPRYGIKGHHECCPGPGLNLEEIRKEVAKRLRGNPQ